LPKDTKQLLSNFKDAPNSIISSIVSSNQIRKEFLADQIMLESPKVVGIYRLQMKAGSDNFRSSAILDLMEILSKSCKVVIYEPVMGRKVNFGNFKIINNFRNFISCSDIVIANRLDSKIRPFKEKLFSRDIFNTD
jgi:UDPglucose 6-dehydrogenase